MLTLGIVGGGDSEIVEIVPWNGLDSSIRVGAGLFFANEFTSAEMVKVLMR